MGGYLLKTLGQGKDLWFGSQRSVTANSGREQSRDSAADLLSWFSGRLPNKVLGVLL